ncbi:hypothetical protein ASPZODRAFT_59286 [Penicilliopsis zonata CBS 506.65]|uniref:Uncharacterized protein n=1 Tax=Penicilliopsis zonata CBS 506.65 TaxID=1073090 RepID=A0A1L9SSN8_9EURO|nr:hypothetical protein ASPZODRAFT_59286 [Penicilliopsis zonata CBS 506.65]OJJ50242.1 hypothetical protein ASPZODRAFT_59286 [Penicilliopsis zonata CBS 506.65]
MALFVAQEAICAYPISTIYDTCPRYLFYALLLASCATRWTGWLADVFLGTAATYAGTAAFQAFILIASRRGKPSVPAGLVSIPNIPSNTTLDATAAAAADLFPALVTDTDEVQVTPAALELDADAVLAIVVTGYLVFLPLQCWSRVLRQQNARYLLFSLWNALMLAGSVCALVYWPTLSRTPRQYMFCYPDFPPDGTEYNGGWVASFRRSDSWNESVWGVFENRSRWEELGDLCFYPCFNTSQILRQQTTMVAVAATGDDGGVHRHLFWGRVEDFKPYVYALVVLCVILNFVLLLVEFVPSRRSRIPSSRVWIVWKKRKQIWTGLKCDFRSALAGESTEGVTDEAKARTKKGLRGRIQRAVSIQSLKLWLRLAIDIFILICLIFSVVVSPFTVIAFVIWIEYYIHHDGPNQESPQQIGQWSPLLAIGLLLISAAILKLKYRMASVKEIDCEIADTKQLLNRLETMKNEREKGNEA